MIYKVLEGKTLLHSYHLNDDVYNYLDTTFEIPNNIMVDLVEVSEDYIARPDLISLKAYHDDSYADVICKLNGISNPFELNKGDILVLPYFEELQKLLVHPNNLEIEAESSRTAPTSKKKNEKRKANEAVVGDKRFSIDTNKRVIIY